MTTLQVRSLKEHTHQILRVRAMQAGQSLSEYVAARLDDIVATPTLDELFTHIDRLGSPLFDAESTALIRGERDSHS
ncbi:MAG: hypothetical protein FWG47_00595 [Propionibacteriaceae bacterium]|nr:hypothetical protein [Propionibacteriaceae bacterium]